MTWIENLLKSIAGFSNAWHVMITFGAFAWGFLVPAGIVLVGPSTDSAGSRLVLRILVFLSLLPVIALGLAYFAAAILYGGPGSATPTAGAVASVCWAYLLCRRYEGASNNH